MSDKPRRACGLYLRVSTDRQANIKEGSLDTQCSTLTKYTEIKTCNTEDEWFVAQVYREEGKSGKNTDRPEYQRMIKDIKSGKLNVLLCTKIDRVHRSLMDFYKLHELLEKHDITFVSLSENWDTSTPMGRFGLKLTLAVAELEREQTSQRVKEKMRWRAEQGLWNGGQILGYDVDPEEKGVIKINPQEATIIKMIFETYRECRSFRQTSHKINKKGYRTKTYKSRRENICGNKKFNKTAIAHILQNHVYIGKVHHKDEVFDGKHEAIIDEKLFNEVNEHISSNRIVRRKPRPQKMHMFLLEGLVRCGKCGSYMTPTYSGGRSNTYFYYMCTNVDKHVDECDMRRVCAEALEDVIARRLLELCRDEKLLNDITQEACSSSQKDTKLLEERKELQKRAIAPIEQEIQNIVKFVAQGKGSPSLADELGKLEVQKKQIQDELEKIDLEFREIKNRTLNAECVKGGLEFFQQVWEVASEKQKKDLFRLFVHKIIFTPEKIKMGLYMKPALEKGWVKPIDDMKLKSTAVNQNGVFAVNRIDWLPETHSGRNFYYFTDLFIFNLIKSENGLVFQTEFRSVKIAPSMTLGERIKELRFKKGLKQEDLAQKSGLALSIIGRYEQGQILDLNPGILQKIAAALSVTPLELLPIAERADVRDFFDYFCSPNTLVGRIKQARLSQNIQQNDLAKMLSINKVSVCRYENDQSKPNKFIITKLQNILNTKL